MTQDRPPGVELVSRVREGAWPYALCVAAVILLGAALRFYYGLEHSVVPDSEAPSGGLFVHFAEQIIASNFQLPAHIPFYTDGGIPYAYPPLAFYIEAVVIQVTGLDPMLVIRLLPAALSSVSIAAFYLMLRVVGLSRWVTLTALAVYALLAANYIEPAEPSGLAEALGITALILLFTAIVHNYRRNTTGTQTLVGLALGLCVLSSPGSAYGGSIMLLVSAAFLPGFSVAGVLKYLACTLSVGLLVASPYLATVVAQNGIEVFYESFLARNEVTWRKPWDNRLFFQLRFFGSTAYTLWGAVILFGALYIVARQPTYILLFYVAGLGLLAIPQEGVWLVLVPACVVAGVGVVEGLRLLAATQTGKVAAVVVVLLLALVSVWYGGVAPLTGHQHNPLPADWVSVLQWGSDHLPEDAKVLRLSVREDWSPVILRRDVLDMEFGVEWNPEDYERILDFREWHRKCYGLICTYEIARAVFGHETVYLVSSKYQAPKGSSPIEISLLYQQGDVTLWKLGGD